jgi:hypothetical protein
VGAWREVRGWLALALLAWAVGTLASRSSGPARAPATPPWQHSFLELDEDGQRLYRLLREGLLEAENARARDGAWPAPEALAAEGIPPFAAGAAAPGLRWTLRQAGLATTYLGEGPGTRWLVLFLEPDAAARAAPAPPTDEEHHTLPDGTALHVTVWTQPAAAGPPPEGVLTFPVSKGWTQRVGQ